MIYNPRIENPRFQNENQKTKDGWLRKVEPPLTPTDTKTRDPKRQINTSNFENDEAKAMKRSDAGNNLRLSPLLASQNVGVNLRRYFSPWRSADILMEREKWLN